MSGYYGAYQYGHFPRGRRAHVVQVGLGDNRTFLHDMVAVRRQEYHTGVGWLLNACSEGDICGVAVEPVWEHFEAAHELAKENRLRNVALVQAALGEYSGRTAIYRVQEPEKSQLDWLDEDDREDYETQMSYLRNMSSVEAKSKHLHYFHQRLEQKFKLTVPIQEDRVPLWTWTNLVDQVGFRGCELLLIDAEGFDVEILRSMAYHCQRRREELPWVIQFESNGLCNARAGYDCESYIVSEFEKLGYTLVGQGRDTYLALQRANSPSLKRWLSSWSCSECNARYAYPYTVVPDVMCQRCADWAWKNWEN